MLRMAVLCAAAEAFTHRMARPRTAARRAFTRTPPCRMPEGPECCVHAESLNERFAGSTLQRAAILSGRYSGDGSIPGRRAPPEHWGQLCSALPAAVTAVSSKGKFIWWTLRPHSGVLSEFTFWSTLGMTGAWSLERSVHSRVAFELFDECRPTGSAGESAPQRSVLFFNDQRNFGTLTVCLEHVLLEAKLATLGPTWLGGGLPWPQFLEIASKQCSNGRSAKVPVARFLMDQGKTAGIGNYILSETLYKASIYPWAVCGALEEADWKAVHAAATETIEASYAAQAALAAAGGAGSLSVTCGTFQEIEPEFHLQVYRQTQTAEGRLVRRDEGPHGRSVFWVAERQVRGRPEEV